LKAGAVARLRPSFNSMARSEGAFHQMVLENTFRLQTDVKKMTVLVR
jgi:hypothetical protein